MRRLFYCRDCATKFVSRCVAARHRKKGHVVEKTDEAFIGVDA